jgi:hypothetical protein
MGGSSARGSRSSALLGGSSTHARTPSSREAIARVRIDTWMSELLTEHPASPDWTRAFTR